MRDEENNQKQTLLSVRIFVCILIAGWMLYTYIKKQNEIVELRLALPILSKEVKAINDENIRLKYEIELFESPIHLMELARKPEFSHLKYPYNPEVLVIQEPPPLNLEEESPP